MNELPLLQTFLAVYRLNSVTRAAELLAMTQPGASGHLKVLETRLGKTLFEKQGRVLKPTVAAHDLARSVAPHLDAIEATVMSTKVGRSAMTGSVHLGGPAEFLSEMVCPKIGPALEVGLRVQVHFGNARELVDLCGNGRLDMFVSTLRIRHPAIFYAPLYREKFVLIASPESAARVNAVQSEDERIAAFERERIIAYAGDLPILRRYWREVFEADLAAEPAFIVPDLRAVISCVANGLGLSVVPHYLCEAALKARKIVILNEESDCPSNQILLGVNKYAMNHPRIGFMCDTILAAFPERVEH